MMPLDRFFGFLCLVWALTLGLYPLSASAQAVNTACDTAKSTAETLECYNRYKAQIQNRLQEVYDKLLPVLDPSSQGALTSAQNSWLSYRDAECSWEAKSAEAPSLARVYEISCITRLTRERIEGLSSVLARHEAGLPVPEFSAIPRWLNVFAHDYPAVFWRHSSWLSADTDCDGQKEQVMAGIKVNRVGALADSLHDDGGSSAARSVVSDIASYIALAENPVTGRPGAKVVVLPLAGAATGLTVPHVCQTDIQLHMASVPAEILGAAEERAAGSATSICKTALEVTSQNCPAVYIYWDGRKYRAIQQNKMQDKIQNKEAAPRRKMILPQAKPKTTIAPAKTTLEKE